MKRKIEKPNEFGIKPEHGVTDRGECECGHRASAHEAFAGCFHVECQCTEYRPTKVLKEKLLAELKTARVRLEICLGRMEACHVKHPEEHEVSVEELPIWIEEMKTKEERWKGITNT